MKHAVLHSDPLYRNSRNQLPHVVIQDPMRLNTFFIPASALKKFEITAKTWATLRSDTVTFVITENDCDEEIPPFVDPHQQEPSVLVQYRKENKAYFLTYKQLLRFSLTNDAILEGDGYVSFVFPLGFELIEELPAIRRVGQSCPAGIDIPVPCCW